ncbi:MAG: Phenylalanine--tRNA ligase alpha subunit [Chlamydiales bacterium]|nr:Phenylalanine--tRNA ligase alpha subunit [Chlamydiales bacterium]MCH9620420.1 Phenylalanine--tRNA ligase alpha subunit [Chlamydiales bacterium]MCH9622934.1 Phenylalanine--tRNA ligase alpha subunit [Chlamydiales bacterium]
MTIKSIRSQFESEWKNCRTAKEVESLKVSYLGKKGKVQALMQDLRNASSAERPILGKQINDLKVYITEQLTELATTLFRAELDDRLGREREDITLPGSGRNGGGEHVITTLLHESIEILQGMGFTVQYGPDIESDYYNFEALNFPKDHPARDMQDTFYLQPEVLLRTHTSNTQVRVMEGSEPPIRVIAPGKCFRNEDISARSHVVFHQIEGLYIDKEVSFPDLFATLEELFAKLFRHRVEMRIRPSYFPFVEPGCEVDISCFLCSGEGCSVCKKSGWLEVAGAGMVHPEVLKNGGIDPMVYSGYAWGFGIERIAMLRYGISDIRLFMENRLDFLQQF